MASAMSATRIAEAMQKVGNEGVISVEEAKSLETELDVVEGIQFERSYISYIDETTSDYDREKLQERLAKPAGGVAVIRIKPVRHVPDAILVLYLEVLSMRGGDRFSGHIAHVVSVHEYRHG
jgi:hypothetical protein